MRLTEHFSQGEDNPFREMGSGSIMIIDEDTGIAYVGRVNGGTGCLFDEVREAIMDGTPETRHAVGARLRYVGPYEENRGRIIRVKEVDAAEAKGYPVVGYWEDNGETCYFPHTFTMVDGKTPCFEPVE